MTLTEHFKNWDGGKFDKSSIPNIDPQSDETLNHFKKDHTFTSPMGKEITFSWHMRFTGGDYEGRVFFFPDNETQKCIIGHIGKKLPTVSWPNP